MAETLAVLELAVPLVLAPLLFVGFARARRLQLHVADERLAALGWFFLLYGIATVARFAMALATLLADVAPASPAAIDPIVYPREGGPFAFHFLVVHALLIASFAVVAWQYLRRIPRGRMLGVLAFGSLALPALEALLALVPAVSTYRNHRGRHTRRSLHIMLGFALLAVGHLGLLPLATDHMPQPGFHLVILSQTLALAGALALVFALPRGKA